MWFGTDDGLNRFDGKNIKVYRPNNDNRVPMGNVVINAIIEADSDSYWLCTEIGLFRFLIKDEIIVRDTLLPFHPIMEVLKDKEQNYWFGTNRGLYKVNASRKIEQLFVNDPNNPSSISNNYINSLFIDSKENLWVGTKKGLNIFNKTSGSFSTFFHDETPASLSSNDITAVFEDRRGTIWVGTSQDGLNVYSIINDKPHFERVMMGSITTIFQDKKNNLWVGHASGGGIGVIDLKEYYDGKLAVTWLKNDPLDKNSLGDNSVYDIFQDRNHDLWISTFGGGVNFYSERVKQFHVINERYGTNQSISNNLVNTFFEEEEYLWIGTEAGLDRLNKKTGKYKHYQYDPANPRSLASNSVYAIHKDVKGNLWIGTWSGGLHRYSYQTDDFTRYVPDGQPGSLGSANVFSICEDSFGNLWIGTNGGGLNRFDYTTGRFKKYIKDEKNPGSLSGRSMSNVYQTSGGDLYISMYGILEKYDYKTDQFEHITPNEEGSSVQNFHGNIQGVFEDSRKNIWITSTSGLRLFNPVTKTHRTYSTNDGLPDNTIQAMLEDDHGSLWISTNKGISKFTFGVNIPEKPSFQNFTIYDGLPTNDFKRNAAYKNDAGVMYFGSSQGFVFFHPDSILLNNKIPDIVFTQVLLLETTPNANSKFREISQNANMIEHLDLHFPNTDFTISFAALNYLNPIKNHYKFKLEGYDTEWIDAGNNNSATYTNLTEGEYTFKVMGSNNDGIWNPIPRQIVIEIFPPWWRTTYFKIFLIAFVIFTISIIVITRMAILNRENKLLEAIVDKRTNELSKLNSLLEAKQSIILDQNTELEKHRNNLELLVEERTKQLAQARVKAEESDRLKSAFLANMSHEIRTPMNAIVGFSNLLVSADLTEEKREKYSELIKNNSKLLFVLINDIIDISIIEANQLVLAKSRFNATTILKEISNYFEFENKNRIEFTYLNQHDDENLFIHNDAIRFRQVVVNLLSNAFKYTDSGKVELGYEITNGKVRVFVADTGCGIDTSDKEKVFDHFYKSMKDKMKLYRGTGIGLAICKRLIEQMGGEIWVDSTIDVGSVFSFTLPFSNKEEKEN
jgi:signal transduction histidine kinase/ligand-binding sensor domain-containing protein